MSLFLFFIISEKRQQKSCSMVGGDAGPTVTGSFKPLIFSHLLCFFSFIKVYYTVVLYSYFLYSFLMEVNKKEVHSKLWNCETKNCEIEKKSTVTMQDKKENSTNYKIIIKDKHDISSEAQQALLRKTQQTTGGAMPVTMQYSRKSQTCACRTRFAAGGRRGSLKP